MRPDWGLRGGNDDGGEDWGGGRRRSGRSRAMDLAIGWFDLYESHAEPGKRGLLRMRRRSAGPPQYGWQHRALHPRVHADDLSRDFLLRVNHAMAIRHQNRMQDAMAAGRISRRFLACFSRTPDPCRTICGDRKRNSYCPRALPPHPLPPPSRQKHR